MIAWGSGGTSKGSFLWPGNVCGSCGHHRPSLNPSEVQATSPVILGCVNSSSNPLLLPGRRILKVCVRRGGGEGCLSQVHEVPSDPKPSKIKGRASRNRAADTRLWFRSRLFNLGRPPRPPKELLKSTHVQILQQTLGKEGI